MERGLSGELTGPQVHGFVMQAALTSLAFIDQEVFRPATEFPWCLGQGCVKRNLRNLGQDAVTAEEGATMPIRALVKRNHNMNELAAGIKLMM